MASPMEMLKTMGRAPTPTPPGGLPAAAMAGDIINAGAPAQVPPSEALASIKGKLKDNKRKSLPGVGFKKPLKSGSSKAKKASKAVKSIKKKMAKTKKG